MSHTILTDCKWRGGTTGVGCGRHRSRGVDRVNSSPHDQWSKHVRYFLGKWRWLNAADANAWKPLKRWIFIKRMPMVAKPDRAIGSPTLLDQIRRPRSFSSWQRVDSSGSSDLHQVAISIGRSERFAEELHDRGPIEPQSRRDRAAIVDIASRNHLHDHRTDPVEDQDHDRGPIMGLFEAKFKPIRRGFEATKPCNRNRLHERVNCPWSSGQFTSLKACISLLCSSTYDRLVKKLSEFQGRS